MKLIRQTSNTIASKILFNLLEELGYKDIKDFQNKNGLVVDGLFGMKSYDNLYHNLLKVVPVSFESNYFKASYPKNQIIWHHSAGWDNARGMFSWWKRDGRTHVATAIGINDDGTIYRGYDEQYWAASIGCKAKVFKKYGIDYIWRKKSNGDWYVANNRLLDKGAVAVEVCNWGYLKKKEDGFYSWANAKVPEEKVAKIDFKGYEYFEAYTEKEIESLKYWTILMAIRFDIPIDYDEDRFWTVNKDALSGKKGLYTHNSYRVDKTDVSKQEPLVKMAKSLEDYMK